MNKQVQDHGTIVYVIAPDENGPCKIGITENVARRMGGLQVGCWLPLAVWGCRVCFSRDRSMPGSLFRSMTLGARDVEAATHKALKDCDVWLRGEWFDVTVEEALQSIEVAARKSGCAALHLDKISDFDMPSDADKQMRMTFEVIMATMLRVNKFATETVARM